MSVNDISLFYRGLIIGIAIAAPVGPIGVLCIRRTLNGGMLSGLASGLGAASADAVYGFIAGFGLTLVSDFLLRRQDAIRLGGSLFLLYLGFKTLLSIPVQAQNGQAPQRGLPGTYLETFLLTLGNPLTILSFTAIFAGLGLGTRTVAPEAAAVFVLGVFLGSAAWWIFLNALVARTRSRFSTHGMLWVNRGSGLVILGFGIATLATLLA